MRKAKFVMSLSMCVLGGSALSIGSSWLAELIAPDQPTDPLNGLDGAEVRPPARWPMPEEDVWSVKLAPPQGPTRTMPPRRRRGVEVRTMGATTKTDAFFLKDIRSGWPVPCMHRCVSSWSRMEWSLAPTLSRPQSRLYGGLDLLGNEAKLGRDANGRLGPPFFPILPIWGGLAFNTAFYAAVLGLSCFGVARGKRSLRRRRGLCEVCAYPRGAGAVCPECGLGAPRQPANNGA